MGSENSRRIHCPQGKNPKQVPFAGSRASRRKGLTDQKGRGIEIEDPMNFISEEDRRRMQEQSRDARVRRRFDLDREEYMDEDEKEEPYEHPDEDLLADLEDLKEDAAERGEKFSFKNLQRRGRSREDNRGRKNIRDRRYDRDRQDVSDRRYDRDRQDISDRRYDRDRQNISDRRYDRNRHLGFGGSDLYHTDFYFCKRRFFEPSSSESADGKRTAGNDRGWRGAGSAGGRTTERCLSCHYAWSESERCAFLAVQCGFNRDGRNADDAHGGRWHLVHRHLQRQAVLLRQ